ncbi:MAG: hypothetical protein KC776_33410 [Myxococcales bacterium]|nr:hypothetical protein [Myxococcales bacterium]
MTEPLEGLDAVAWRDLEDAYGPAVDVPDLLRAIRDGDEEAVFTLHGHVFHQGASYYSATAPTVPFLVRLACAPGLSTRRELLGFLSEMTAGHQGDGVIGWEPYAFRSTPASLGYPEADATVAALRAHTREIAALLGDPDAGIRAHAAHVLAGLGGADVELLQHGESDPAALGSVLLARARLGAASSDECFEHESVGVRACAAIANAWTGDLRADALESAALLPASECWDGFAWGSSFAPLAAGPLARTDGALARLMRVIETRLARGDRLTKEPELPPRGLEDVPFRHPEPSPEDGALRALVAVASDLAFAAFGDRKPILRDELNGEQLRMLRWTVDHGVPIPVAGIPWFRPGAMRRYLEGDGPLDTSIVVDSEVRPLWAWLREVDGEERVERLIAGLTPKELLAIADDLLSMAYTENGFSPCLKWQLWAPLERALGDEARAVADEIRSRARACGEKTPSNEAVFLVSLLLRLGPLGEEWDELLSRAAYNVDRSRPLLEALPLARRSRVIGRLQNAYTRKKLVDLVDIDIYRQTTLRTLLSDAWWADRYNTRTLLTELGKDALAELRAALSKASGGRARVLEEAIGELSGSLLFTLRLGIRGDAFRAELSSPDGTFIAPFSFPAEPKAEDLRPLAEALEQNGARELSLLALDGHAAPTSTQTYRLTRTLEWPGMRAIHGFTGSLRRAPPGGSAADRQE